MWRIAAPMIGGVFTSFVGELIVYPALYFVWRSHKLRRTGLFDRAPMSQAEHDSIEGGA